MPLSIIRIAAAVISRPDGKVLLVKKRGAEAFIQPGGKIEPGETPVFALCRELREELGLTVDPAHPAYIGRYTAPAANEPGCTVAADLFRVAIQGEEAVPAAEIEAAIWIDPAAPGGLLLAPLTRDHILPLLAAGGGTRR